MTKKNVEVEDIILRPNEYLIEEYGESAEKLIPAVRTHDQVVALLATMDQQGTKDVYGDDGQLWRRLIRTRDIIEEDIESIIEDEFDQ